MKRLAVVGAISILLAALAVPALADSFTINVCNVGISSSCTISTTPVGTIDVTQVGAGQLQFTLTFDKYSASDLQWGLGSQGGGDTLALQLQNIADLTTTASPDGFTLSNVTATLYGGANFVSSKWTVDAGLVTQGKNLVQDLQHEDGFGDWNVGIDNPDLSTGKPSDSLIYLQFTLNKTGLTLSDLTFNTPDSNCDPLNVQCFFAMHVNAIDTATGNTNFNTGYAGATRTPNGRSVPEPATLALLGAGVTFVAPLGRRLRRK